MTDIWTIVPAEELKWWERFIERHTDLTRMRCRSRDSIGGPMWLKCWMDGIDRGKRV